MAWKRLKFVKIPLWISFEVLVSEAIWRLVWLKGKMKFCPKDTKDLANSTLKIFTCLCQIKAEKWQIALQQACHYSTCVL